MAPGLALLAASYYEALWIELAWFMGVLTEALVDTDAALLPTKEKELAGFMNFLRKPFLDMQILKIQWTHCWKIVVYLRRWGSHGDDWLIIGTLCVTLVNDVIVLFFKLNVPNIVSAALTINCKSLLGRRESLFIWWGGWAALIPSCWWRGLALGCSSGSCYKMVYWWVSIVGSIIRVAVFDLLNAWVTNL